MNATISGWTTMITASERREKENKKRRLDIGE
jgi:hypothetical protein